MGTRAGAGGWWEPLCGVLCRESPTSAPRREMLAQAARASAGGLLAAVWKAYLSYLSLC